MNQRRDVRQSLFLDVTVYQNDKLITRCSSGNVSRGGIFIETERVYIPIDTQLTLKVEAEINEESVEFNFHAHVVYAKRRGLGLAFKKTRAELSRLLIDILSKQNVPATSLNEAELNTMGDWYPFKPLSRTNYSTQYC